MAIVLCLAVALGIGAIGAIGGFFFVVFVFGAMPTIVFLPAPSQWYGSMVMVIIAHTKKKRREHRRVKPSIMYYIL